MPEVTRNVTTGTSLLHEAMQESIKQSLAAAGFPVYEFDPATERFKDTVSGEDIGYEVRFPYWTYLDYQWSDSSHFYLRPGISIITDLSDPELVVMGRNFDSSGLYYENSFAIIRRNLETGELSSKITLNASYYYGYSSCYYDNRQHIILNPEQGYFIDIVLGYHGHSSGTPRLTVYLVNYNFQSMSASVRTSLGLDISSGSSIRHIDTLMSSKVYKYETEDKVYYSVLVYSFENPGAIERLLLFVITYDKTNKSISTTFKAISDDFTSLVPWEAVLPQGESYVTDWVVGSVAAGLNVIYPLGRDFPNYGIKESLVNMESPTGNTGHAFFFLKGLGRKADRFILLKVPFTFDLDTNSPVDSTVTFDLDNLKTYGPVNIFQSFNNGYVSLDMETIEFPRRSTYTPPNNYRFKVEEYTNIHYVESMLIVNNNIDQDRISLSVFLYGTANNLSNANSDIFAHPYTTINNFEITPGGSVYFTGHTVISHAVPSLYFLCSRYHPDTIALATISPLRPDYSDSSSDSRSFLDHFLFSFSRKTTTTDMSSDLSSRLKQPYLAKISLSGLTSYLPDTLNTDLEKTVYKKTDYVFLTNVIWLNHYQSGFFVPVFYVLKPGGDGIWFRRDTIYVGIGSYDSTVYSPRFNFMVNGAPIEILPPVDYTRPDYGSQVNSTLSLVYRLIVPVDRTGIFQIGTQGSNPLRFARIFTFDVSEDDGSAFGLYAPFANLVFQVSGRGGVIPFANIPASLGGRFGFSYKSRALQQNVYLSMPPLNRPYFFSVKDQSNRVFKFGRAIFYNDSSVTVDGATSVVVIANRHPDIGTLGLMIPTPTLGLYRPLDFITAVDKSNTLTVGDYVFLKDQEGNLLKYVIVHWESLSYYVNIDNNNTTNYRAIYAARIE